MKKTFFFTALLFSGVANLCILNVAEGQNVGVNTTGAIPNSSALLDVDASPANNKGILIPRVSLTDTADVTTIATPATSLKVYNTNVAMAGGNGAGYYYWSGTKWLSIPAPANGPGASGQVLTSQGTGGGSQWKTLTSGNSTGTNISEFSVLQGSLNWVTCYTTCRNLTTGGNTDWRMPTLDEIFYAKKSGVITPPSSWSILWIWTATAYTPTAGSWVVMRESNGSLNSFAYTNAVNCRCVR